MNELKETNTGCFYYQVVPDSQFFTTINQILEYSKTITNQKHIDYLITALTNTINKGFVLKLHKRSPEFIGTITFYNSYLKIIITRQLPTQTNHSDRCEIGKDLDWYFYTIHDSYTGMKKDEPNTWYELVDGKLNIVTTF